MLPVEKLEKYGTKDKGKEYLDLIEDKYLEILNELNIEYTILPNDQDEQIRILKNFLFIAHGNNYEKEYYEVIKKNFEKIGCKCDILYKNDLKDISISKNKLSWANIIYIGGGNTLKMMNVWRRYKFNEILNDVKKEDKIFCGISAGCLLHDIDIEKVLYAISHHDLGQVSKDKLIGGIWDADRLSLYRFKCREIDLNRLSTEAGM